MVRFSALALGIVLLLPSEAHAHSIAIHKRLTEAALEYLALRVDPRFRGLKALLVYGSEHEDTDQVVRPLMHFTPRLDEREGPLYEKILCQASHSSFEWGFTSGLNAGYEVDIPVLRTLVGTKNITFLTNEHTWDDAVREAGTDAGWRHLGYVVHLLEDVSSPPHARNDCHLFVAGVGDPDPFEELNSHRDVILPSLAAVFPTGNQHNIFAHLQSYTQSRFYSKDSMFRRDLPGPDYVAEDDDYLYDREGRKVAYKSASFEYSRLASDLQVDPTLAKEQLDELSPIAILHVAALIKYYYDTYDAPLPDAPPPNQPPTAGFSMSGQGFTELQNGTLNLVADALTNEGRVKFVSASSDPDNDINFWRWRAGAVTLCEGPLPCEWGFMPGGPYTVILTVRDVPGHEATASATINVAPAPVTAAVLDDFDDQTVNTHLWTRNVQGVGPTVAELNGRLEIRLPPTSIEDPTLRVLRGGYSSVCQLRGDFDIQVNYQLLDWPFSNGVRVGLGTGLGATERTSFGLAADFPGEPRRETYLTHFQDGLVSIVSTTDTVGTLRQVRVGNTVSGYYRQGQEWVPIGSAAAPTTDVGFSLSAWSHAYAFSGSDVRVAFDDITLNAGEVICSPLRSAWPMWRRDAQHTGTSRSEGPTFLQSPVLFGPLTTIENIVSDVAPLISGDGTVYVSTYRSIHAFYPDGSTVPGWPFVSPNGGLMFQAPAIGDDGTVYAIFGNSLYAVKPDGSLKWPAPFVGPFNSGTGALTIGADGTLYAVNSSNDLLAVTAAGSLKWTFHRGLYGVYGSPTLTDDGTIIVLGGNPGHGLTAVTPSGALRWSFEFGGVPAFPSLFTAPAVATDGTLYAAYSEGDLVGPDRVFLVGVAIDGSVKYRRELPSGGPCQVSLSPDGSVVCHMLASRQIMRFTPDLQGVLLNYVYAANSAQTIVTVDGSGTIYMAINDADFGRLLRLELDGSATEYSEPDGARFLTGSIGADGTLYVGAMPCCFQPPRVLAFARQDTTPAPGDRPVLTGVTPSLPLAAPADQRVTFTGLRFQQGLTVTVGLPGGGTSTLSGTQITAVSATSVTALVTYADPGRYIFVIHNPDGTSSDAFALTVGQPTLWFDAESDPGLRSLFGFGLSAPVIDRSGNLMVASFDSGPTFRLHMWSGAGQLRWSAPDIGTGYSIASGGLRLLTASDGSTVAHDSRTQVFAFDGGGHRLAGWPSDIGAGSFSRWTPFVVDPEDGTVYAKSGVTFSWTTFLGSVVALSPDGSTKWESQFTNGGQQYGVVIGPRRDVYTVDSGEGRLVGLDRETGLAFCDAPTFGSSDSLFGNSHGVFIAAGGTVSAHDHDCRSRILYSRDGAGVTNLALVGPVLVVREAAAAPTGNSLLGLSATDGSLLWRDGRITQPRAAGQSDTSVYVFGKDAAANNADTLFVVDAQTGGYIRTIHTGAICSLLENCEIAPTQDGDIYFVDRAAARIFKVSGQ